MYNLGEHFSIDLNKIKPDPLCVITGDKYRFTVLTERLIRLEFNNDGKFNDLPTMLVSNRNFKKPIFDFKENTTYLEITTSYFKLIYNKGKNYKNVKNFRVELLNTDRYWNYGHVEARNYSAPLRIENGKIINTKSLYSNDGFASIVDDTKLMGENGIPLDSDARVDIYLFMYNNDFNLCLKDYFNLTGYPALIPRFALGNWWSRNNDYNDSTLKELIDNFKKYEIPISIVLLDKDWHVRTYEGKNHLKTGFTFNKDYFSNPYEMINYLHSNGIRIGLNVNPTEGFYKIDDNYEQAIKYLKQQENGVIPFNVLDPKCVDVYLKLYMHPLDAIGIDFFWLDFLNKDNILNDYLVKYYQFKDMTRNYKRRPFLLGYNDTIAEHRYPVLYSGKTVVSWDSLKQIPFYNINAANNGISFYSHDVGGYFKGIEDNELYIRYVQLATFSPILKFGADKGTYYKREPWRWNIKTLGIVRDYLQLRHKLIPYLYSEAYKYYKEGVNIITPLYHKAKEMYDDPLYKDEYYFGSQLFICPITKKKDYVMDRVVHRFYIPEGVWYDFFTGKKFPGNKDYVTFYKDQHYPVFAKAGSIIPLGRNDNINDTTPPKDMEIHFFPGVSNEYYLYEDDGISSLYEKGFYLLTKIEYNYLPNNYTVILRAMEGKSGIVPERRNYKFVFRDTKKATDVIVYENREQINCTSYVSGTDFIVEVKDCKSISQLTINCKGKDIEIDATRLINEDIFEILDDLQIETLLKEEIDKVIFSDLPIKKKRIEIRKLERKGLDRKFVKLFLNLLEYVSNV